MTADIKQLVDDYAKWDQLGKEARKEIEKIKAQLQKSAVEAIGNSKVKTVKYFGTDNNIAIATTAETVKMASVSFLRSVLGDVTGDFVKEEEPSYKMTDPFKKMMAPLCTGSYIEQKLDDVIAQMDVDEVTARLLKKKLKGDPERDAKTLASIGMAPKDIEYWVYFIAESIAYEKIVRLLEVAGYPEGTPEFETALKNLKLAVIVEETLKIGIEYETDPER
jgi:hypothetical protein